MREEIQRGDHSHHTFRLFKQERGIKMESISQKAEKVINNLERNKYGNIGLTTSQIRKFLSMVNMLRNKVDTLPKTETDTSLPEEILYDLDYIKVKLIYQSGREPLVKNFVLEAKLIEEIDRIQQTKEKVRLMRFFNYVEALVAYHKFEGGK